MNDLNTRLRLTATGTPVIALVGGRLALVGEFDMASACPGLDDTVTVDLGLTVPACSCPDSDNDVDPECPQHCPEEPADLLELIAKAVAASRHWELGAGPDIDGATAMDVNAARAVIAVLLHPGRNGVVQ